MAYRDEHERCPRCNVELIDAVVGAGCSQCRGVWLAASSLATMAAQMQVPPEPVPLPMFPDQRSERLPCPTCHSDMAVFQLFAVPIDVCHRHGMWFDTHELGAVLFRAARTPAE